MENFIVGIILVVIIGAAITYIIKEKKKGTKCIGCPHAGECQKRNDKNNTCS
ncbi:MAG: FeoB-associated Cys-rich membrane protein [Lachnospiraceae bacterium]|nr:FeoB-associated Cys-rich membrane protein [Lachnospiraceae bacterium]